MTRVIRAFTAAALSVAIPLGALCAPLVHAHVADGDGDHHGATRIHAHVTGHSPLPVVPGAARIDDHDGDRAVYLQLFVAVAQASLDVPAAVVPSWDLATPAESPARRSLHVVHGHDPPFLTSVPSRAPPVFSVLI